MRLLWKYIRNYFLVYQLISHILLYLQNYKEFEAEILDLQSEKYGLSFDIKKYTTSGWALGDENMIVIRAFKNELYPKPKLSMFLFWVFSRGLGSNPVTLLFEQTLSYATIISKWRLCFQILLICFEAFWSIQVVCFQTLYMHTKREYCRLGWAAQCHYTYTNSNQFRVHPRLQDYDDRKCLSINNIGHPEAHKPIFLV